MALQGVPVANYQVSLPEKFSFKPEDWTRWIRCFQRFRKATGLDQKSSENQVNTQVYLMGEEADDTMISFGAKFNLRSQQEGQLKPLLLIYIVSQNTVNLAY